jgi:microcystin-dependent protein
MAYFKTKNLGLETPETGNAPVITSDLKKLAEQLDLLLEPGDLKMSAVATPPTGWLACEGQEVSRTTYANLFTAISTKYGAGNGTTTFNVPNFTERVPVGVGSATGFKLGEKGGQSTVSLTVSQIPSHNHGGSTGGGSTGSTSPFHSHTYVEGAKYLATRGFGAPKYVTNLSMSGPETASWEWEELGTIISDTNTETAATTHSHSVPSLTVFAEGGSQSHTNVQPYETCHVWIKT